MKKLSHITILNQYSVNMDLLLGKGSTGSVYQGLEMKSGSKVAIKIIDLKTICTQVSRYLLSMEKSAIMKLKNPYLVEGLQVAQDNHHCFIVTKFCEGGSLKNLIQSSKTGYLQQQEALRIFRCLLTGQKWLIQNGILHRDLKPDNIMFDKKLPKIIDFGYCQIDSYPKPCIPYNVGSPSYMAPESYFSNIYNEKTEIWTLGVILFQSLTGKTLDQGRNMRDLYKQIDTYGPRFPCHVTAKSRKIINWCLEKSPKKRPNCNKLLSLLSQEEKKQQVGKEDRKQQRRDGKKMSSGQKNVKEKTIHRFQREKYRIPEFLQQILKNRSSKRALGLNSNQRQKSPGDSKQFASLSQRLTVNKSVMIKRKNSPVKQLSTFENLYRDKKNVQFPNLDNIFVPIINSRTLRLRSDEKKENNYIQRSKSPYSFRYFGSQKQNEYKQRNKRVLTDARCIRA